MIAFLPDDRAAVREMIRVVKPGGRVIVSAAALEVLRGDDAEAWQERRRYTPAMMRALAEDTGLEVERVSSCRVGVPDHLRSAAVAAAAAARAPAPDRLGHRRAAGADQRRAHLAGPRRSAGAARADAIGSSVLLVAKKRNRV